MRGDAIAAALAGLALVMALVIGLTPTVHAGDPTSSNCDRVANNNVSANGCISEGGIRVGAIIRSEGRSAAGDSSDSAAAASGNFQLDCDSTEGRVPTRGSLWIYNVCNGTRWIELSNGVIWDCGVLPGGNVIALPDLYSEILEACGGQQGQQAQAADAGAAECLDAREAARRFPTPEIGVNPELGLTGLVSYFWLRNYRDDMQMSVNVNVNCTFGSEWRGATAQVDAWVVGYYFSFGDGTGMWSPTPGAPWPEWLSEVQHTYERSSLQQPDQKYQVRAWAFWEGRFTVRAWREVCQTDSQGNETCQTEWRTFGPYPLGQVQKLGRLPYPVQQAQSVIVDPTETR